jgi:Reverse transcriptase (RNA-dependent DNA polymerase)
MQVKYKEERTKVKNMVKQAKEKSWAEFGAKMEENAKENEKLFYKALKGMRTEKQCQRSSILDKDGELLTDDNSIMNRWKDYFQSLLGNKSSGNIEQNRYTNEDEEQTPISKEEVTEAINALKNGKAPGYDRVTAEMLKNLEGSGIDLLCKVYNKVWEEETVPQDWTVGLILPIFKKGNTRDCNNYRGITLLSTALKTYERILENRLRKYTEPTLDESQSAFRKGRGVQDHIFTMKQVIEKIRLSRSKAYFAFVDLEKAFDKVQRGIVWNSLEKRGIDSKLLRAIKSIYKSNTNYVIHRNRRSEGFATHEGLRQGGVLSPLLFNVFIDEILTACKPYLHKLHIGYKNLEPIGITQCLFADDLVITASTEQDLQNNINTWNQMLQKHGMKINIQKTKVMMTSQEESETMNIIINNERIEQVDQFKYLGVVLERDGNQTIDINERISRTVKLYHGMNQRFIRKKEISTKTKMIVYKTIYRPILTYGSETWVLTPNMKSKIQAVEMKYLRGVKGISRRDRIRNMDIREELQIEPIHEYIQKKQLNWWGHVQRMSGKIPTKKIWETRIRTRRGPGRPRATWSNEMVKILTNKGQTLETAKKMAKDRKQWKQFVQNK